jgi:hypothetical protein
MADGKWIDVSAIGDCWEVEMDALADPSTRSAWRYRSAMFGNIRTEWMPGRPPTGPYAQATPNAG